MTIASPSPTGTTDAPRRPAGVGAVDPALAPIVAKARAGERLSFDDGLALWRTPDIHTVCRLADLLRRRLHRDVAYYNVNRHLNYSNVCALSCSFCSFYRKKDGDGAYEYALEDIAAEARAAQDAGATEIHVVGGLHPWLPFKYYPDLCRTIRSAAPDLHIKAFTAVEIVHLARIAKRGREGREGLRWVLSALKDAGLGSLPGGGAEVFDDRVHDAAFKGKIRAGTWLEVHEVAHELGLNSNATMLYGHVERPEERIVHLMRLREEQDRTLLDWARAQGVPISRMRAHDDSERDAVVLTGPDDRYAGERLPTPESCATGFFQTIIPLPFIPDESALERLPGPGGLENLRMLAVSRLMLDNFPHAKAFWIMQTLEMATLMLECGADDIDGTVVWYDITKVGGATTHQETSIWDLERAIVEAGFRPVERDTLYRPVQRGPRA